MKKTERRQKVKIKDIISEIDTEGIKSFILQYAKNDSAFEIAFKSHFISRISTGIDESSKYKRILDEIIKPKNAYNQKINPSLKKTISIVMKDLVLQMHDCLSSDNYVEAYYLIKECLEKIEYLQHRYFIKEASLERCRLQLLTGLESILDLELAPAFRSKMEKELTELCLKSYFFPQDNNLIELLNQKNVFIHEDKQILSDSLYSKIKLAPDIDNLSKTLIQLAHPFDDLAKDVVNFFGNVKIFTSLKALIKEGKFIYSDFLLNNKTIKLNLNTKILTVLKLIEKQDFEAISKEIHNIDIQNIPVVELRSIIDELPEVYLKKEFKKIKLWVDNLPFGLKTNLYFHAGYHNELITMLEDKNDVEWIKVYDNELLNYGYSQEIKTLYQSTMDHYLQNHLGTKAKEYVVKVQQHLFKNGHHKIAEDLTDHIANKFSYRISLN